MQAVGKAGYKTGKSVYIRATFQLENVSYDKIRVSYYILIKK